MATLGDRRELGARCAPAGTLDEHRHRGQPVAEHQVRRPDSAEPGSICAERAVMLKARRQAHRRPRPAAAAWRARCGGAALVAQPLVAARWPPSGLKAASAMCADRVRSVNTICSMTRPVRIAQLRLQRHGGRLIDPQPIAVAELVLRRDRDHVRCRGRLSARARDFAGCRRSWRSARSTAGKPDQQQLLRRALLDQHRALVRQIAGQLARRCG